ncbi:MAG: response regulator [Candidatus Aegiribacteria sp.]|nr:response regulator [Candidatus Aegiribacteria sp.]
MEQEKQKITNRIDQNTIKSTEVSYNASISGNSEINHMRTEEQHRLAIQVLQELNKPAEKTDMLRRLLLLVKMSTGFEAVGIRLKEDNDFPYYVSNGFSDDFIKVENYLCARDKNGEVIKDQHGEPYLECMCGNIIRGRTDPSLSFFTEGGSFWSNCTSNLLASTSDEDRQTRTRNRCNTEGYESVAIIPLNSNNQTIGTLQLNDRRKDMFTRETIDFFEKISVSIGIAFDRKLIQEELIKHRENLEQLIDARTIELRAANEELQKEISMRKRIEEKLLHTREQVIQKERLSALGQMASGIAHDFNNSLVPILGFSDLLLSEQALLNDKNEVVSLLKEINSAAEDARKIVQRLREVYKRDNGVDYRKINLGCIIEKSVLLTKPKWQEEKCAEGNPINIHLELHEVPPVLANATELREVFTNLILNSVDAMPDGGSITIRMQADAKRIMTELIDTGGGMTAEVYKQCMDPFFTTKGSSGTGLGLSMVHGIINRHKGSIQIDSEPGKGTRTLIYLPADLSGSLEEDTKNNRTASGQPLHILIIDDDSRTRDLLERFLKLDNHVIEVASTGMNGIDKFRAKKFDLVITDRAMPDISGDCVAETIRETHPNMPIILLTGFGDIMKDKKEKPPNIDLIFSKPVTHDELRYAINKVTNNCLSEEN